MGEEIGGLEDFGFGFGEGCEKGERFEDVKEAALEGLREGGGSEREGRRGRRTTEVSAGEMNEGRREGGDVRLTLIELLVCYPCLKDPYELIRRRRKRTREGRRGRSERD